MNEYVIALSKCKGIGNTKLSNFIKSNDFSVEKMKHNLSELISSYDYNSFDLLLEEAKKEIESNAREGINIITMLDTSFPKKLYECKDPVVYLYYKGNWDLVNKSKVAVIGSRKAGENSLERAKKISSILSAEDICVVSGLALGIDTFAHFGALEGLGKTIAVLPSDIKNIAPVSNKKLALNIVEQGGLLISEYPVGYQIDKYCYVKRDRIQSLLSDAVLVIEADEKSGTMNAVSKAMLENKPVYQLSTNNNLRIYNSLNIDKEEEIINFIFKVKNTIL